MAGHARYTALLDACVLHPMAIADALMSLASAGLYAAKWSRTIESEWVASIEKRRPELKGKLGYRRDQMREAVPDSKVTDRMRPARLPWRRLQNVPVIRTCCASIFGACFA
jgi:hypothetical protein